LSFDLINGDSNNQRWIEPIVLLGKHVTLEPLEKRHLNGLQGACRDGQLWKLWYTQVPSPETMQSYISTAINQRDHHGEMPFAIIEHKTNKVIGSTRYLNVDEKNRRLEIGYTWYASSYQRTAMNTECKLLLLTHAFEQLNSIAVEFRTHWINHRSRKAIERLGAKLDGVLRNHTQSSEGVYRDTVVYSIINQEWPMVKTHLNYLLS
jgi:RimJ/RimL family protein N-acetyltransferase